MKQKFGTFALIATALMIPVSILAATITEFFIKHSNPNHVDITAKLAYLRPILHVSFAVAGFLFLAGAILAIIGIKKDQTPSLSKLALLLLVVISIMSGSAVVLKNQTDKIERTYTKQQLNNFFRSLSR